MRFYERFAERPFCIWNDFRQITRFGDRNFADDVIHNTFNDFTLSAKHSAIVAMDRLRVQGLFGPTREYEVDYEHGIRSMYDEILFNVTASTNGMDDLIDDDLDTFEQDYYTHLEQNILANSDTDPYQQHKEIMQTVADRFLALAMLGHKRLGGRSALSTELLQAMFPLPKFEDVFDLD